MAGNEGDEWMGMHIHGRKSSGVPFRVCNPISQIVPLCVLLSQSLQHQLFCPMGERARVRIRVRQVRGFHRSSHRSEISLHSAAQRYVGFLNRPRSEVGALLVQFTKPVNDCLLRPITRAADGAVIHADGFNRLPPTAHAAAECVEELPAESAESP
jgi:hypothetical protein